MTNHYPGFFRAAAIRSLLTMMLLWYAAATSAADNPFFKLQSIGPGTYVAVVAPGQYGGANVSVVIGTDSVAVIDSFMVPQAAKLLLEEIHRLTPLPVRYVINTHYHLDHVGGNGVFRDAGAVIIAHPNVTQWQHTDNPRLFGEHLTPDMQKLIDALPTPSIEVSDSLQLNLGGRSLVVRSYPGHSGSDLAVFAADVHTVFCGDLFWNHSLPNLIDANVKQQQATIDRLLAASGVQTFVPGHGKLGDANDVRAFKGFLIALRKAVTTRMAAKTSDASVVTDTVFDLEKYYGGWDAFDYFAADDVRNMLAELKGTKHQPGTPAAAH